MFFLLGKTVSNSNPGFRSIDTFFERLMGKVTKIDLFFEMPQTAGIDINSFKTIGLEFIGLLKIVSSISIPDNFHIGFGNGGKDPASVELIFW